MGGSGGVRKIEMQWTCSACEHTNLGRFKTCQRCGDPNGDPPRWPAAEELAPAQALAEGERERERREAEYHAVLRDEAGRQHRIEVASADELLRCSVGSRWRVAVWPNGVTRVLSRMDGADAGTSGTPGG